MAEGGSGAERASEHARGRAAFENGLHICRSLCNYDMRKKECVRNIIDRRLDEYTNYSNVSDHCARARGCMKECEGVRRKQGQKERASERVVRREGGSGGWTDGRTAAV